ncbi:hypothetical protein METBIDRAFT_29784 [Metschnikowia bicuspidata var. bicuspidata NRRL YB-4993]|uniref:Uncharacterized protein n=1 Tax=Metschnikowia bicuspidata var. bicuspidata NRRL YB-4993 TaxID=869754 RepID=A0A1A0HHE9_9ASCO|nr:hypothetical protein METBIDRAFT_29784 [Metschnikowia bicuspidata var. bicuspidata NRRL YB-4993]OBA23268.1 hypothetical protein METBIDRAFT_29784 [Metschnikowia bicuspidata var. bicuspidata NRRL YB-4993]
MLKHLVFPLLASLAAAASSDSCSFSTTISAASGVLTLNACPTLSGDITITGDDIASVDLSGVQNVAGDLTLFNSSSFTSVNFNSLVNVTGSLAFTALTQVHSVDFAALNMAEDLLFVSLPSLASLNLGLGLADVTSLTLSDTALSSIDNLLQFSSIHVLNVNNNKNITLIDLSSLELVSGGLTLSFNNDDAVVRLGSLQWAANFTLQDVAAADISNLLTVNGSFIVGYNSFDAVLFESLTTVGASLQVFANDNLETLELANLTSINGEFHVFNNSLLLDINLDSLETVKGAVDIEGAFGNFTMPSLDEVEGDFTVLSTSEDFSCEAFDSLYDDGKFLGANYNCSSPSSTIQSSSTTSGSRSTSSSTSTSTGSGSGTTSSSSSSSSSSSRSGASAVTPAMVFTCAVAAAVALLV